jgi:UDPglucose 6-dehydrogenase
MRAISQQKAKHATRALARTRLEENYASEPHLSHIAIVGSGIVGTATALSFAKAGKSHISIFDVSKRQEENSSVVLERELEKKAFGNISFCPDISEALKSSDYVAVCVPTPQSNSAKEAYDYTAINQVMQELNDKIESKTTILIRSTVDPLWLREKSLQFEQELWYVPEFLREKSYLADASDPDHLIVGLPNFDMKTMRKAERLFSGFACTKYFTTLEAASLVKLFVNAFLATKISFFNQVGQAALKYGEDPREVASLIALDRRIGDYGILPGKPYDGKCLPKDVEALLKLFGDLKVVSAARAVNNEMMAQ